MLYNAVSGNHSLPNSPLWGGGLSIANSRHISGTIIQFLPTMPCLRISYAWYIYLNMAVASTLYILP